MAILSFADEEAAKIFNCQFSKRLPRDIQRTALRKLIYLDKAQSLNDLRIPPSNHLEQLHGDRTGQYSIRINKQYRICFTVRAGGFDEVEIVDYH
jgi:proteic killer suppression protein